MDKHIFLINILLIGFIWALIVISVVNYVVLTQVIPLNQNRKRI